MGDALDGPQGGDAGTQADGEELALGAQYGVAGQSEREGVANAGLFIQFGTGGIFGGGL